MLYKPLTFTFTFGSGGLSHPAMRPIQSSPMHIPDITRGYENLFDVLTNRKKSCEMTYNVSMGTLNPTIPYFTLHNSYVQAS